MRDNNVHDIQDHRPVEDHRPMEDKAAEKALAWTSRAGVAGVSILKLVKAEIMLAISRVPSLIAIGLVMIQFWMLIWFSVCLLVSWGISNIFDAVLPGAVTFLLLQIVGAQIITRKFYSVLKSMLLPYSRKNISDMLNAVSEVSGNGAFNESFTKETK